MTIKTKLKEKFPPKSEFGRGFLICLLKFAEHAERYVQDKHKAEKSGLGLTDIANLWFYGASDHLLELQCPESFKGTRIEECVKRLRDYVEKHRLAYNTLKGDDIVAMMDLCREIALLVDKKLGLDPDLGEY